MADLQYSVRVRDAQNDALETTIGAACLLEIYDGTKPADCAAALSGNTLLATGSLPSDWMAASSGGVKTKAGTWLITGTPAAGGGTAGKFFRIYDSTHTNCDMQGSFGATGSGALMTADNNSIANGQQVQVNTFSITRGNA
jgi:hypothetical protein